MDGWIRQTTDERTDRQIAITYCCSVTCYFLLYVLEIEPYQYHRFVLVLFKKHT